VIFDCLTQLGMESFQTVDEQIQGSIEAILLC
jgi:hypothetical protein